MTKECFSTLPIAIGLQKNSPYKVPIDYRMQQLKEAGIISKIIKDGIESLDEVLQASQDSHPIIVKLNFNFFQMGKKAGKVPIHSISLAELQGPFFIWLILLAFSAVVCMIEKLFKLR